MKARYIFLINAVWTMLWSTIIFISNGDYPRDYLAWLVIVYVCILLIPWVFLDQEGFVWLMHDSAKDGK